VLLSVSGCSKTPESNPAAEHAAIDAAQKWLSLVDGGQYSESWEQGAEYFRNAISKDKWEQAVKAVRVPLGAQMSRVVKSKQYTTSVPGAPDGQYVVIQFTTSFKNKVTATETVTPMLDKDGSWRVSGYFIK
jgi:hypothetical protein